MKSVTGVIHKMKGQLNSTVQYSFIAGENQVALNPLIDKKIKLNHTGNIFCIQCGRKTKKSFQQGYCFPCMRKLQECNMCLIHPERCQVEQGTCPEDDWAHTQCHASQILYLANTSGLKVGITRDTNIPTRWIDQGAVQALPIMRASNRFQVGLLEVIFKKYTNDKTDWRAMLRNSTEPMDLIARRDELLKLAEKDLAALFEKYSDQQLSYITDAEPQEIDYPIAVYPEKIKSLSLDKTPEITGVLKGIKGQYLYLDESVINIRKFGGYEITLESEA